MNENARLGFGLLAIMLLLAVADSALVEGLPTTATIAMEDDEEDYTEPEQQPETPPPQGGVRKSTGPDVLATLVGNRMEFTDTNEKMILSEIVTNGDAVQSKVMLFEGDRAGFIAWIDSPYVKNYYLTLKESLHASFTSAVTDLVDETQRREGTPTRNILTFRDTGLLPERVVFVRVRERLYEFHVPEGSNDRIFALIEDLTE